MELESQENSSFFTKASNVVLVVLVLAALMLGYFLYQKVAESTIPSREYIETPTNTSQGNKTPSNTTVGSFDFSPLSDDERAALNTPPEGATKEQLQAHFVLIEKTGVHSGELAIGVDCKIYPVVLKTRLGKDLAFRNYDSVPHTITFNKTRSFSVPANKSITVPINFEEGAGIYGYGCDQNPSAAGMMLVAE